MPLILTAIAAAAASQALVVIDDFTAGSSLTGVATPPGLVGVELHTSDPGIVGTMRRSVVQLGSFGYGTSTPGFKTSLNISGGVASAAADDRTGLAAVEYGRDASGTLMHVDFNTDRVFNIPILQASGGQELILYVLDSSFKSLQFHTFLSPTTTPYVVHADMGAVSTPVGFNWHDISYLSYQVGGGNIGPTSSKWGPLTATPEPTSLAILAVGAIGLIRKRQTR